MAKILVHEGDDDEVMTLACFPEMFHLWMDRALKLIPTCIDVGKKSTIPPVSLSAGLRGAFVHNAST
jgi:hypothetical protein